MNLKEKLLSRMIENPNTHCWEWQRGHQRKYGAVHFNGKTYLAHRASYQAFIGEIPEGLLVCHHCDNPSCINPKHLFIGTYLDNRNDCKRKGRINYRPDRANMPSKTFCAKIIRIKRNLAMGKSISEIATNTKMTMQQIADIRDKITNANIGTSIKY